MKILIHPDNTRLISHLIDLKKEEGVFRPLPTIRGVTVVSNEWMPKSERKVVGFKSHSEKEESFIEYEEKDWGWLTFFDYGIMIEEDVPVMFLYEGGNSTILDKDGILQQNVNPRPLYIEKNEPQLTNLTLRSF